MLLTGYPELRSGIKHCQIANTTPPPPQLLSSVKFTVSRETAHPRKRLAADRAHKQFCSGVHGHVILQSSILTERAITQRTLVRLLPGVDPPVRRQTARRREPVLADRTFECLLAAVSLHVKPQVLRPAEHLSAQRALIRFLTAVDSRVSRQVSDPRKPLVANLAFERFLTGMAPVVYRERGGAREALATLCAQMLHLVDVRGISVRLNLSVRRLVPQQAAFGDESFVAYRALVRLDSAVRSCMNDQVRSARETLVTRRADERAWLAVLRVKRINSPAFRLKVHVLCRFAH